MGASRVLQAVAKDVLFGPILGFVTRGTINSNPVAAILVCWFVLLLFLFMGSLNAIAQLSSVIHLVSSSRSKKQIRNYKKYVHSFVRSKKELATATTAAVKSDTD